ncbi:polysaccharide biosynthesis protein [Priestia flexa]|uniref:polysaccharide biosynthesis protein n=1 Tax=Priestia flexa TaxID=86664 RepID=UPI00099CE9A5|nr:nucleoside-diphosphate sugar epimerase/dehydratase [Priestia flexa]AQX55034.1 hypothetical protein BC359_12460 [Priestia flexa]
MTHRQRLSLFIVIDSCIVFMTIFISRFLVNSDFHIVTAEMWMSSLVLLLGHHLFAIKLGLYYKSWEYASVGELVIILKAVSYSVMLAGVFQQVIIQTVHVRLLLITWLLHLLLIGGSRFVWRVYLDSLNKEKQKKKRTLIVGAGSAGTMVVRQLVKNKQSELYPVAFIDDNVSKQHLDILGVRVVGGLDSIDWVVSDLKIDNIIIAIPSLTKKQLHRISKACVKTRVKTQTLPMLEDLVTGKVSVNQFQDVKIESLLGREPVDMDMQSVAKYVTNKTVLITGAGGSIGSEIARQITGFAPKQLILLGHGENSIYSISVELKEQFPTTKTLFITEIADIQDAEKMMRVMKHYAPDVVYHAAAHKHVPLMEHNPEEAVKNNVIGTMNVARAASDNNVNTFVMISSDKAVNPTSVMGATKKLAESIVQYMNEQSATTFVAVRFGNVLGSRGSVIPLFKKQIEAGGPVTVTDPEMVRYFMTIPEASRLVIQAGALAKGGEVFVLDMGKPVRIVDLAKNLITLSGYSLDDIDIAYTGIRPGEKLFEELLTKEEVHEEQVYPKIYVGKTSSPYFQEIERLLATSHELNKHELRSELIYLANKKVDKTLSVSS